MEVIDITLPLDENVPFWPGDPRFASTPVATVAADGYAMRSIAMGTHTGTHVDAPAHFVDGGMTADALPTGVLCGEALVLDARPAGKEIDGRFLDGVDLGGVERLLLRTVNEELPRGAFTEDLARLTPDGARYLRSRTGVRLVGIDSLSIETGIDPAFPVHRILLAGEPPILILEGIDLRAAAPGRYELLCLPLPLRGCDGAPARALLRRF